MRFKWKGMPSFVKAPESSRNRANAGSEVGEPSMCGCQRGSMMSGTLRRRALQDGSPLARRLREPSLFSLWPVMDLCDLGSSERTQTELQNRKLDTLAETRAGGLTTSTPLSHTLNLSSNPHDAPATVPTGHPRRFYHLRNIYRHKVLCLLSQGSLWIRRLTASVILQQSRPEHSTLLLLMWVPRVSTTLRA